MTIEISATVVAWYAAIVATISAAVSVYNVWRDRARLIVRFAPDMQLTAGPDAPKYLSITVVNGGRRPITVSHLFFSRFKKQADGFLAKDSIPHKELKEGEFVRYLCEQSGDDWHGIRYAWIHDSVGRIHARRIPKRVLETIARTMANSKTLEGRD